MALVAFNVVPVAVAFFDAAVILLFARSLSLREAYDVIEWPILIMLGALIPVSNALRTTGGTNLIESALSHVSTNLPPIGALALLLAAAMAVTPFLNNAATVLVMAPIAASLADKLGYNPGPVPHGRGDRRGMRFPHADRASMQHAGDGPGRLSLWRLLEARPAAIDHRLIVGVPL